MQDSTLLKVALLLGISGVIALFIVSEHIEVPIADALETHDVGETVRLTGQVAGIREYEGVTIIELERMVPIVVFDDISLEVGDNVHIIGEVAEYRGKRELILQNIE